jgi:hypothetical protein
MRSLAYASETAPPHTHGVRVSLCVPPDLVQQLSRVHGWLDKGGPALADDAKRDKNLGIEPKKVNSEKANKARGPLTPEVGVTFRGPDSK